MYHDFELLGQANLVDICFISLVFIYLNALYLDNSVPAMNRISSMNSTCSGMMRYAELSRGDVLI
jgi:hypothetical protein